VSRMRFGVGRQGTIVEGQNDFAVLERQRFAILHGAEAHVLAGIHHNGAAHAECAWRALGGPPPSPMLTKNAQ